MSGGHLLDAAHIALWKRYWWVAASLSVIVSLVATGASIVSQHVLLNNQVAAEVHGVREETARLSARLDGLADAAREAKSGRAAAEQHFQRVEGVLHALTASADRSRDDVAAIREALAVERERLGFLFDRASPARR